MEQLPKSKSHKQIPNKAESQCVTKFLGSYANRIGAGQLSMLYQLYFK